MGSNRLGKPSALMEAIRANSLHRVVSALEERGDVEEADIHGYRGLPLRTACFMGNVPIVRELIARGANLDAPTADGSGAPLRLAMRAGHAEIVALLLAHNAQIPFDLDIPASIFERAKELSSGRKEILDMPMLEFDQPTSPSERDADGRHDNMLAFVSVQPGDAVEPVDLKSMYGVDTSVISLDFARDSGAFEKTEVTPPVTGQEKNKE